MLVRLHRLSAMAVVGAIVTAGGCTPGWDPTPAEMTFPLIGKHEALECVACHPVAEPLSTLPTDCAACHEPDRPADHYAGDCAGCHTPFGWSDIVVDHGFFPLTHAHALDCVACHASGYRGLDPSCASCHEPDRPTGHFGSQDCGDCHAPTRWQDGDFDHSAVFPLPHFEISACVACHVVPGDYSQFACIQCHEHAQPRMDDKHRGVTNYEYADAACLSCHPRPSGD